MKKGTLIITTISFFVAAVCVTLISSCSKNLCAGVSCLNGGTCADGTCSCPTGYFGDRCQNNETDKYTGNYYLSTNNQSTLTVTKGLTDFDLVFTNDNSGSSFRGSWSASGIVIPNQNTSDNYQIRNGTAVLNNNTLNINYEIYGPSGPNFSWVWTSSNNDWIKQ